MVLKNIFFRPWLPPPFIILSHGSTVFWSIKEGKLPRLSKLTESPNDLKKLEKWGGGEALGSRTSALLVLLRARVVRRRDGNRAFLGYLLVKAIRRPILLVVAAEKSVKKLFDRVS